MVILKILFWVAIPYATKSPYLAKKSTNLLQQSIHNDKPVIINTSFFEAITWQ